MKLYIREERDREYAELHKWWDGFEEEAMLRAGDDKHLPIAEAMIAEFNGKLCQDFWELDQNEYIEFPSEKEATLFLLRWL